MKFTFYLFKKEVKTPEQAFREGKLNSDDGYVRLSQTDTPVSYQCDAYILYESVTTPPWVKPMSNHFQINEVRARNVSNSLVLLIPVEDRLFGVTYGYGFTAINRSWIEKDFGKMVAANEVDPKDLRQMDSRDLDTSTRQTSVITNRPGSINDYKFNTRSDLITLLAGVPSNRGFASRVTGARSLIATMDIDIDALGGKCKELLDSYRKQDYKTPFGFIDRFTDVEDVQLIENLKLDLEDSLINMKKERIFFAVPHGAFNSGAISYYKLQFDSLEVIINDIEGDEIFAAIKTIGRPQHSIEGVTITGFDENHNVVICEIDLLDYVVYETQLGSSTYILMDGDWYQIDQDFYDEVSKSALEVEEIEDQNFLPSKIAETSEGEYNKFASVDKKYLLLDKELYHFGGYDKIEVCDLLTPNFDFICVKPYSGSSTLSHLFSQGLVSGRCLTNIPAYKDQVEEEIKSSGLGFSSILDKENREITFVYAIATHKQGKLVETLPFFSKLTLLESRRELKSLGFKVKVFKIPESKPIPKTKKCQNV